MTHEAAQAIVRRYRNVSDAELSNADINLLHREITTELIPLESELAALRQIVADVETCANCALLFSLVTIHGLGPDERYASRLGSVLFYGPTWQAALHAAAEQVRRGLLAASEAAFNATRAH